MAIDLHIKRIRNTPYKLVFSREEVIGMFDHNKYVSKDNMNETHKGVVEQHHADNFVDRIDWNKGTPESLMRSHE